MKCRYCQKEIATQADYDAIPEGEGKHLCWSAFKARCIDAEEALDVARARIAELESILANNEMSGGTPSAPTGVIRESQTMRVYTPTKTQIEGMLRDMLETVERAPCVADVAGIVEDWLSDISCHIANRAAVDRGQIEDNAAITGGGSRPVHGMVGDSIRED